MKKLIVFIALSLTCYLGANAQIQNFQQHPRAYTTRKSFWEETNIQGSIDSAQRWQYQIDYQQRRMADASWTKGMAGSNTDNIMKNPYQYVVRPWIHYWVVPKRVRLSLSPLGYWLTYTPAIENSSYSTKTENWSRGSQTLQPEFRICPQVTVNDQVGRLLIVNRYRYEFRFQGNKMPSSPDFWGDLGEGYNFNPNPIGATGVGGTTQHAGRFRWQVRMMYVFNNGGKMLKNSVYLNAWNELFLATGRHTDITKVVNQNRTIGMIGWKLPTDYPIRIEAGITYQANFAYATKYEANGASYTVLSTTPGVGSYTGSRQVELNTAYTIYVIFDEFHTLFKKKKQPQDEPKYPHPEKL
jgi:hypothetical protein